MLLTLLDAPNPRRWLTLAARFHLWYNPVVSNQWKKTHRAEATRIQREWSWGARAGIKLEVLSHYGPEGQLRCAWPDCGVTDVDMLSLDHVNDDGACDRNEHRGGNGFVFYGQLKKKGFPAGFQTLCHNHQWKKELTRRRAHRSKLD